jgi:hypothetical protein
MKTAFGTVTLLTLCLATLRAGEVPLSIELEAQTACHGTAVRFVNSPAAAAKLAAQQDKVVFVLHVSGHFEDPNFT